MRIVKYTSRFRRDYKREQSGRHGKRLDAALLETVTMLAKDEPLPRRYFDHPLSTRIPPSQFIRRSPVATTAARA
jgi:mRNA interferase YafQ